jgi:hypothetical protein
LPVAGWPTEPTRTIPVADVGCATTASYTADLRSALLVATGSLPGCGLGPNDGAVV